MNPEKEKQVDTPGNEETTPKHDGLPKENALEFEMEDRGAHARAEELLRKGEAYEEIKKDKDGNTTSIITRLNSTDEIIYAHKFRKHPLDRPTLIDDMLYERDKKIN